jgi:hypothetical protein
MPFDANTIEPLIVTGLAEYGIEDFTIPEPSNVLSRRFGRFMVDMFSGSTPDAVTNKYAQALEDTAGDPEAQEKAVVEMNAQLFEAMSELCSGVVTAEQLEAIPTRLFGKLFLWLLSEMAEPTVVTPPPASVRSIVRKG